MDAGKLEDGADAAQITGAVPGGEYSSNFFLICFHTNLFVVGLEQCNFFASHMNINALFPLGIGKWSGGNIKAPWSARPAALLDKTARQMMKNTLPF